MPSRFRIEQVPSPTALLFFNCGFDLFPIEKSCYFWILFVLGFSGWLKKNSQGGLLSRIKKFELDMDF